MTRLVTTRAALLMLLAGLAGPAVGDPSPNLVGPPTLAPNAPAPSAPVQSAPPPSASPPVAAAPSDPQAPAASAPAAEEAARYSFHRMGDGFVRLDSRTGQLAQCGWGPAGWSCKTLPDERAAFENEIGRLQRENSELKKSMLERGIELPPGVVAEAPVRPPVPPAAIPDPSPKEPKELKPPTEADLDRAMTFMKNVWRKLVDMMVDLQRDIQKKS